MLASIVSVYLVGIVLVSMLNLGIGPVLPELAVARAVAWPIWITTGRPRGERLETYGCTVRQQTPSGECQ